MGDLTLPPGGAGAGGSGPRLGSANVPDPEEIASRLDAAYASWLRALTDSQRSAIGTWQDMDRGYVHIQAAVSSGEMSAATRVVVRDLLEVTGNSLIPEDLVLWRGIRSSEQVFGISAPELRTLIGQEVVQTRFLAGSLSESVARDQFTKPELAGGAVLLRMKVAAGIPAAWIAGAGRAEMRSQLEVLLRPRHSLRIVDVQYPDGVPVIEVEVV